MPGKMYFASKEITVTSEGLTCGRRTFDLMDIAKATLDERQPKGKSGCFYGFGAFLLLIGGSIYEVEMKAAIGLAIAGAVISIIGMNMRDPKPVFTLKLEMEDGRCVKAFTTRDREVGDKAMKAITRAFKQFERDQARQDTASTT